MPLFWKRQPEVAVLFIRAWHRLRIKALLFSGSVSSERSSSSAPCFLRTKSPLGSSFWLVSSNPVFKRRFLFYSFGFHNISPESALLFGSVKGESYFTHFKLAPRLRSLAHLLNSRVCVCGEQGVDKRLLNGGGKCSRGVRTPRSGWEWGVFVAKLVALGVVWQILQWGRRILNPAPTQPAPMSGLWLQSAAVCKKVSSWLLIVFMLYLERGRRSKLGLSMRNGNEIWDTNLKTNSLHTLRLWAKYPQD